MKIFIPTYAKYDGVKTLGLKQLKNLNVILLVHNNSEYKKYIKNYPEATIYVTEAKVGVAGKQNQIKNALEKFVKQDEWCLFLDDDISKMYGWSGGFEKQEVVDYTQDPQLKMKIWFTEILQARFLESVTESIMEAENIGAKLCGYAVTENPMFNCNKWSYRGFVHGKAMIWKRDSDFVFDENILDMDDYSWSLEHLYKYKKVIINRSVAFKNDYFGKGGHNDNNYDRDEARIIDSKYLIKRFPQYVKNKPIKNKPKYFDIKFATWGDARFEEWLFKLYNYRESFKSQRL